MEARKIVSVKWWLIAASVLLFVAMALPIGVSLWYTTTQLQHECHALELLTAVPVKKPGDAAANPSREATYRFYLALLEWERADSC